MVSPFETGTQLLDYIAQNNGVKNCTIATNCILALSQEIYDKLKNSKFIVRISNYGTANEKNLARFLELLEKNNIRHRAYSYANQNSTWSYLGGINTPKQTKQNTIENFEKCIFTRCMTLENGIISRCSRATVAHFVQKFKPKKSDFLNVRSLFFNVHNLKSYWNAQHSNKGIVTACYYCYGTSGKAIVPGEQLSKTEYKEIKKIKNV